MLAMPKYTLVPCDMLSLFHVQAERLGYDLSAPPQDLPERAPHYSRTASTGWGLAGSGFRFLLIAACRAPNLQVACARFRGRSGPKNRLRWPGAQTDADSDSNCHANLGDSGEYQSCQHIQLSSCINAVKRGESFRSSL